VRERGELVTETYGVRSGVLRHERVTVELRFHLPVEDLFDRRLDDHVDVILATGDDLILKRGGRVPLDDLVVAVLRLVLELERQFDRVRQANAAQRNRNDRYPRTLAQRRCHLDCCTIVAAVVRQNSFKQSAMPAAETRLQTVVNADGGRLNTIEIVVKSSAG